MASNFISGSTQITNIDELKKTLKNVTDAALFIEQLLAAAGVEGAVADAERLTVAFSSLAMVAIQAAHEVAGREITPGSVLQLLPVNTPLVQPAGAAEAS